VSLSLKLLTTEPKFIINSEIELQHYFIFIKKKAK
jgi:hypothetical protein